jgi:hypothetical protein
MVLRMAMKSIEDGEQGAVMRSAVRGEVSRIQMSRLGGAINVVHAAASLAINPDRDRERLDASEELTSFRRNSVESAIADVEACSELRALRLESPVARSAVESACYELSARAGSTVLGYANSGMWENERAELYIGLMIKSFEESILNALCSSVDGDAALLVTGIVERMVSGDSDEAVALVISALKEANPVRR